MVLSITNLIYLVEWKPLLTQNDNRIEVFNEICIYLCAQSYTILLNSAAPIHFMYKIGILFISIASFNIVTNVGFSLYLSCVGSWGKFTSKMIQRQNHKRVKERIEKRKYLTAKAPGIFKAF